MLSWGSKESELRDTAKLTGVKIKSLEEKPIIPEYLNQYFDGFFNLSGSRIQTFSGPGNIPISEIKAYCDLMKMDDEEIDIFFTFIKALDLVYVTHKPPEKITLGKG